MTVTPQDSVDAANYAYGTHPGRRALHAKGILLKGTFTATSQAAALSRAAHLQGQAVPITARVSNGGGDPDVPDYVPDVRGLAVKFYLPDGSRTDIVAASAPRWFGRGPDGFVDLLRASKRGPAMAWKFPLFLARHPDALPTLPANLAALKPPTSYASIRYFAIHAYKILDADGTSRFVRYTWMPELEEPRLGPRAARQRGRDYLTQEIRERLERGPVRFTLELQIAAPGDEVDDPSSVWPADRERVIAGTLELIGLDTERERDGDVLVFDPGRVTDGIERSGDLVLRYRPAAYSESIARRTKAP